MKLILLALLLATAEAPTVTGAELSDSWLTLKTNGPESLDGVFFAAYVVGVFQGMHAVSSAVEHVPNMKGIELIMLVGNYVEKNTEAIKAMPAAKVVLDAVMEKFPPPKKGPSFHI